MTDRPAGVRLLLLGRFALLVGGTPVDLGGVGSKILAALALQRRPVPRGVLGEMLWPERPTDRSRANLRSAIWRMPRSGREIVEELGDCLALADRVDVDLRALVARCRRLFEHPDELGRASCRERV